MTKHWIHATTTLALALLSIPAAAQTLDGQWAGAIELPRGELAVTVQLSCGNDADAGTIDIPAQGIRQFELAEVSCDEGTVHFEMAGIPGRPTFDGELSETGEAITGTFRQGPQSLRFTLERGDGTAPSEPVPGEGIEGDWLGRLAVGPAELRLALHVEAAADGSWQAVLDSIDQGTTVPVESLTFADGRLAIDLPTIRASYEGSLDADGSTIEGEWSQNGRVLPLTFERQAEPMADLARPQDPQPPFPYETRDVVFHNETAGIDLAGTLLVPRSDGPFPAVLFVSGSGPQDRDEQLMGHRPFRVIADHLARHGIASLRFDDRGVGGSGGDHFGSSIEGFASDVEAGLDFLLAQPEVAPDRVGILGHSEGGVTGPLVAARDDRVAFVVAMAPPGVPLADLLRRQTRDLLRLRGIDEELVERMTRDQAEEIELIRDASLTDEALEEALRQRLEVLDEIYSEEDLAALGYDEATTEQGIRLSTSAWFRSLMRVEPSTYWSRVTVPVLALFGEKDIQVAAAENARAVRAALDAAGNESVQIRVFEGLNHLFQHAETGGVEEYAIIEETIAPEVLELLSDWIAEQPPRAEG